MTWEDRIQEAIYTSPGGVDFVFQYEDVSKEIVKKTTAFEFPDVEGTYVQDLGKSGRRYPMRIIFWGEDYDIIANQFDAALEEKGPGKLQHPFYGKFTVVPFGSIRRRDDLVSAANQTVFEVTFWETIEIVFPSSVINVFNSIEDGIFTYEINAGENFDDSLSIVSAGEIVDAIAAGKAAIRKIRREMAAIAATTDSIERQFNDAFQILDDGMSTLIGTPLALASQLIQLTKLPAQASSNIQAKLDSYKNLLDSFTQGPANQFESGLDSKANNSFSFSNLVASATIISSIESTISETAIYATREQTILAIESLIDNFDTYVLWADENRENLIQGVLPTRKPGTNDMIDTGESYQYLQGVFALANGRLTDIVFSALQERSIKLTHDRSLLDFAAEYYSEIDNQLDFIIESNNLTGSEILELPKGREMVYYV